MVILVNTVREIFKDMLELYASGIIGTHRLLDQMKIVVENSVLLVFE